VTGLSCSLYSLVPYFLILQKRATPWIPSLRPMREVQRCSHPGNRSCSTGCAGSRYCLYPQGTVVHLKAAIHWFPVTWRQARGSRSLEDYVPQHIFIMLWCLGHVSRSISIFLAHASELCSLHFKLPWDLCFGNQRSAPALLDLCLGNWCSAPTCPIDFQRDLERNLHLLYPAGFLPVKWE